MITKDDFVKAYTKLVHVFHKKVMRDEAEDIYEQHFSDLRFDIEHVNQAIRSVGRNYESFPSNPVKAILAEMDLITIYKKTTGQTGCTNCEGGLIHFNKVRKGGADGAFSEYKVVAHCNCKEGQRHNKISPFSHGHMQIPQEEFTYKREIYVVELSVVEVKKIGNEAWKKVCSFKDLDHNCVDLGEVSLREKIWLTLEQAKEVGIQKAATIMGELDAQEETLRKIKCGAVKPGQMLKNLLKQFDKKSKAVEAKTDCKEKDCKGNSAKKKGKLAKDKLPF